MGSYLLCFWPLLLSSSGSLKKARNSKPWGYTAHKSNVLLIFFPSNVQMDVFKLQLKLSKLQKRNQRGLSSNIIASKKTIVKLHKIMSTQWTPRYLFYV